MMTNIKPFIGTWGIVEMEAWDQEYVNMDVPGHFTFKKDSTGHFQFGLVRGEVTKILKQLLASKGQQVERTFENRFAAWRRGLRGDRTEVPRRTVGELRRNADSEKTVQEFPQDVEVCPADRRTGVGSGL
jgi:hypothetical protein